MKLRFGVLGWGVKFGRSLFGSVVLRIATKEFRLGRRISDSVVEIKVWGSRWPSDSAGNLRRRRSRLGRRFSEGVAEIQASQQSGLGRRASESVVETRVWGFWGEVLNFPLSFG